MQDGVQMSSEGVSRAFVRGVFRCATCTAHLHHQVTDNENDNDNDDDDDSAYAYFQGTESEPRSPPQPTRLAPGMEQQLQT